MHAVYGNVLCCIVVHTGGTVVAMLSLSSLVRSSFEIFEQSVQENSNTTSNLTMWNLPIV